MPRLAGLRSLASHLEQSASPPAPLGFDMQPDALDHSSLAGSRPRRACVAWIGDLYSRRTMQTLLTIDPDAYKAEALLRTTSAGEPQKWRSLTDAADVVEFPSVRLTIDGIAARITRTPWTRTLDALREDNCEWGPHVEYIGTLISIVLLNGRIFRREIYARLIREGCYSDQGFGCRPLESFDGHPQARAVVDAWEAHFGRPFTDTLIIAQPIWAGRPKPSFIPHATLTKFLRLAAWLHFASSPAPWLFRREPLHLATKLVPDDPEARILDAVEVRLRAGETLAATELADLGLADDRWWTSKLLHLSAHPRVRDRRRALAPVLRSLPCE